MVDETAVAEGHVRRARRAVDMSNFDFENFRGLVILLDFTNKKFASEDPQSFYSEMFSSAGFTGYHDPITDRDVSCPGSVRDYFNDQSDGAFAPPFDVYGPYPATYIQNGVAVQARSTQCNSYSQIIFNNALKQADGDVNFSRYDNNHDGKIDMVYFLVAGYSSSYSGNNRGYLWPHASNLSWTGSSYDGKKIDRYASSTELYGFESSPNTVTVEGIGTVAHEFSHVLGLPDFYDTDYEDGGGESHHPGGWDIMADGGDYNFGRSPVGYSYYERYSLGWAEGRELTESGSYTAALLVALAALFALTGGLAGFFLGGNLDFLASLDFVAVLDAVGTLEVLNRNACLLGDFGQRFTLLDSDFAGLFGLGVLAALAALVALGTALGGFVAPRLVVALLLGIFGIA